MRASSPRSWQAILSLGTDDQGRPDASFCSSSRTVVVCSTRFEAAVARDLAAAWLQALTGQSRKQSLSTDRFGNRVHAEVCLLRLLRLRQVGKTE
jgi:hypothetical protein